MNEEMKDIKLGYMVKDNNGRTGRVFRLESYFNEPSKVAYVYFITSDGTLYQVYADDVTVIKK